jgi:hypothetical protein
VALPQGPVNSPGGFSNTKLCVQRVPDSNKGDRAVTIQESQVQHFISPKQFCERNCMSLTTLYQHLKTGRLHAFKQGRLTFIPLEEEERYRATLPAYEPKGR